MKLAFCMGLFLTATLFSFGQTEKATPDQKTAPKKQQRIKVVMNKNGKEMKMDTAFNFIDHKMIRDKVDSIMVKLKMEGIDTDDSTCMFRHGGKRMHWSHLDGKNFPNEEQFEMFIEDGDTGKVKHGKKIVHLNFGENGRGFGPDCDMIPPPPPPMPPFHVRAFGMDQGDPFAMDPKDPDIVSYDKKDIGKGLEKITIIRKKHAPGEKKGVRVHVEVKDEPQK